MKGFTKTIKRTPFMVTSKVGMAKTLFTAGSGFATHFSTLFHPISGEYDLIGKNPDAGQTIRSVSKYETAMEELRSAIGPELELIESRIVGPVKELQQVMKLIRKTITKRDHKLTDYDRFNNSLTKLRDKKEKSLSDEKNLFKLEQDFELATNEYDFLNNSLKSDLPRFMTLSTQFIDPLFSSFYYMQLNIFYLLLEKMNGFAEETKWDVTNVAGSQIERDYEEKRTDAWSSIEELNITKRIISVSKMVQANRSQNGGSGSGSLGRSATSASSASSTRSPPPRMPSNPSFKKTPPPIPGSAAPAPPPPYTPSGSALAAAASKRAPPPPPPLKPKPRTAPKVHTGDRIEVVERGASAEDWWTGRVNGHQGVFPGNYVQDM
ncbi:BAR-domain-containing protein [Mycena latifolia]|nr:BAR-domain-containing protein [Mycena latifolia]